MPNYIKNILQIHGTDSQVKSVTEKFSTHFKRVPHKAVDGRLIYICKKPYRVGWLNESTGEFEERGKETTKVIPKVFKQDFNEAWTRFPDFEKIIPMPKELSISENGWLMPLSNQFSEGDKFKACMDKLKDFLDKNPERKEEEMTNFIQGIKNYLNYGHATWYNWSVENWGVKWNSAECKEVGKGVFEFETAWSGVGNLIELISKEFPEIRSDYEWSDEDTGANCGAKTYLGGIEVDSHTPENGSKEAYELAFKHRPENRENYELVNGNYQYKEE